MKIVFLGSPEEVIPPLEALISHPDHQVIAVVSQPPRRAGRGKKLVDPAVASFAKDQGILTLQPEKANAAEFLKEFASLAPDVAVTAAYGQILTDDFLKIPKRATINIHPSLLPKYRGATPVQASLLEGDEKTGVSVLFTVKALDAGNIISQKEYQIAADETADILLKRLFKESAELLLTSLEKLADRGFTGMPQNETKVSHCKKIAKEDGRIDWHLDAQAILNRFRALYPWPGSFSFIKGRRIGLTDIKSSDEDSSSKEPGMLTYDKPNKQIKVATGKGTVLVHKLKPEGSKEQDAAAFWNGLKEKDEVFFDHE